MDILKAGDKVQFILGNIEGHIIEVTWRNGDMYDDKMDALVRHNEPDFEWENHKAEQERWKRYSIRLPSGAIIRELRIWELKKVE